MDVLINDFSVDGQFESVDDFVENLSTDILPLFRHFETTKCVVYKSFYTYDRLVTSDVKLIDILHLKGKPEIQRIKSRLSNLVSDEPFWQNCETSMVVDNFTVIFAETLKRNGLLLSFRHSDYSEVSIELAGDEIQNCHSENSGLNHLYNAELIDENYFYCKVKNGINIEFFTQDVKNHTQEIFNDTKLTYYDKQAIKNKLLSLIKHIVNGTDFANLSKNLSGGLWEFRCDITDTRTFRIFYVLKSKKVVFLNGFIKKTQQTPQKELDKAKQLAKLVK